MHRPGLVHRDVSARNVLVEEDGTFVLADLGLAQEADSGLTTSSCTAVADRRSSAVFLPLRWCSPEVLRTTRHTNKSDVWSLCVTLWEMITAGMVPYGQIQDCTVLQHQLETGRLLLAVPAGWVEQQHIDERPLAQRVVRLVSSCLAVHVEQRPDASQLLALVKQGMAEWDAECRQGADRIIKACKKYHSTAA